MRNSLPKDADRETDVPKYGLVRERLRRTRQQRGISLREAAAEIGVSAPTLSRIERGASRPDIETLDAVASWVGLDRSVVYASAGKSVKPSTPIAVQALILSDPALDAESAAALSEMFRVAYEQLTRAAAPGSRRRRGKKRS